MVAAVTVSLSVPDELRDKAKELGIGNWSAILQTALRREIMLEEAKRVSDVEGGLARLRASRDANEEAQEAENVGVGKKWALEEAEADQVERVAEIDMGSFDGEPDAYGWGSVLYCAIENAEKIYRPLMEELMEHLFGRKYPTAAMARGFVRGVAEIYEML
ncbi:hypothetical protein [Paraburkholderia hospita]|uniref:hypothetical protein n=1 Tax=Paraburkholderia hospita TaxID=169430 RepID=UPI0011788931|nr:hypothetical protein [Paraburkholderia hospita]